MDQIRSYFTAIFKLRLLQVLVLFALPECAAQQYIGSLEVHGPIKNLTGTAFSDSILISYYQGAAEKTAWLTPSGLKKSSFPGDYFSANIYGTETYFYFVEEKSGQQYLGASVSGSDHSSDSASIPLNGEILGYTVHGNLKLLLLDDDEITIRVMEVSRATLVSEVKFTLPLKLDRTLMDGQLIDFIDPHSATGGFGGLGKIKIFFYEKIYITIDRDSYFDDGRTEVITLNHNDNSVTIVQFAADGKKDAGSFILDNKLFRISSSKKLFTLSIFDLASRQRIAFSELKPETRDFLVYFRYGRKNVIHHREKFSRMAGTAGACVPMISVFKHNGNFVIKWGTYFNDNGMMGPGIGGVAGMMTMIVGTAVKQLSEGPGVHRYFYYEWNVATGTFQVRENPAEPLTAEKIDAYEIGLKKRFKHKQYIDYKSSIAAIYHSVENAISKTDVVYFE
jgi:hypothetical protein